MAEIFMGMEVPSDGLFQPPSDPASEWLLKPSGALWTSPAADRDDAVSEWHDWVLTETNWYCGQRFWEVVPRHDAEVLVIEGDLFYRLARIVCVRGGWAHLAERYTAVQFPDPRNWYWSKGGHWGRKGIDEFCNTAEYKAEMLAYSLDVPSTIWLRKPSECFDQVKEVQHGSDRFMPDMPRPGDAEQAAVGRG